MSELTLTMLKYFAIAGLIVLVGPALVAVLIIRFVHLWRLPK